MYFIELLSPSAKESSSSITCHALKVILKTTVRKLIKLNSGLSGKK